MFSVIAWVLMVAGALCLAYLMSMVTTIYNIYVSDSPQALLHRMCQDVIITTSVTMGVYLMLAPGGWLLFIMTARLVFLHLVDWSTVAESWAQIKKSVDGA